MNESIQKRPRSFRILDAISNGALGLLLACGFAAWLGSAGSAAMADVRRGSDDVRLADGGRAADGRVAGTELGLEAPHDGDAGLAIWQPPGASVTPLPSEAILPPETITIRFSHRTHVKALRQACNDCHPAAYTSDSSDDALLPTPSLSCDPCHGVIHADTRDVKAGLAPRGRCAFCHVGAVDSSSALDGGPPAAASRSIVPSVFPRANLKISHRKHAARNIRCGQCHGRVEEIDLATREQLPRMAGCLVCHTYTMSAAAQGDATGTCVTCHITQPDGRIQTVFRTGTLRPQRWLGATSHDADWIEHHKSVAADDSALCASCHTDRECMDCHDGNVRPRSAHPNDWLSMHAQAARVGDPRCSSCHNEQTFCADCHRRLGIASDTPSGNRPGGRRFHLPAQEWTNAPRGPNHHSWEAMRNLNACVSCHTERDCASCHATKGVMGGGGVNPHPTGFRDKCGLALRNNPRPCFVCHPPGDATFSACR